MEITSGNNNKNNNNTTNMCESLHSLQRAPGCRGVQRSGGSAGSGARKLWF